MYRDNMNFMVQFTQANVGAFLFDKNEHFAGVRYVSSHSQQTFNDTPIHLKELTEEQNELMYYMKRGDQNTQIVGFRTTKACEGAKQIMSVQPIYYSIDKTMCEQHLLPLSANQLEEITEYGPSCAEISS